MLLSNKPLLHVRPIKIPICFPINQREAKRDSIILNVYNFSISIEPLHHTELNPTELTTNNSNNIRY